MKAKIKILLLISLVFFNSNYSAEVIWEKIFVGKIENIYEGTRFGWQYYEALKSFDIDADGDNDILVGMTGDIKDPLEETDPLIFVIENLGNEEFVVTQRYFVNNEPLGWINDFIIGDLNNDGKNDLVPVDHGRETGAYSDYEFSFPLTFLSKEEGLFLSKSSFGKNGRERADGKDFWHGGTNARDLNGDGNLDIVMAALSGSVLGIWSGDGKGNFSDISSILFENPDYANYSPQLSAGIAGFVDSGNDGLQDVFAFPYASSAEFRPDLRGTLLRQSTLSSYEHVFLGDYLSKAEEESKRLLGFGAAAVYDFDRNGYEDILLIAESSNWRGEQFIVMLSQEDANEFVDTTISSLGQYSTSSSVLKLFPNPSFPDLRLNGSEPEIALGDYNGDGFMDFFVTIGKFGEWTEGLKAAIYFGDNDGKFTRNLDASFDYLADEQWPLAPLKMEGVSDLNNDGISDIFVMDRVGGEGEEVNNMYLLISKPSQSALSFIGTDGIDNQSLNELNNTYEPFGGNDTVDGLAGIDTFKVQGNYDHWISSIEDESLILRHKISGETKTLISFERILFSDGKYGLTIAPCSLQICSECF